MFITRIVIAIDLFVGLGLAHADAPLPTADPLAGYEQRLFASLEARHLNPLLGGYALACLNQGAAPRGVRTLAAFLQERISQWRQSAMQADRLACIGAAADAFLLLQGWSRHAPNLVPDADVAQWVLGRDGADLARFVHLVRPEDNWPEVWRILHTLHDHDPDRRDAFSELSLALAVVWDQPRPPLHPQIGPAGPGPPLGVTQLYDYFQALYGSGAAKLTLRELAAESLIFVVDLPVAPSDLAWTRANITGTLATWKRRYEDVRYDVPRLTHQLYTWPHGPYTLPNIQRNGGICVDQAYFAAVTARAWGIPAVLLTGAGRRGPHAWFGYMDNRQQWHLDIGRYDRDRYTTGLALNPQTNQTLTDHDLAFRCDRAMQPRRLRPAAAFGRLAAVLLQLNLADQAGAAAAAALDRVPIYPLAWEIQAELLRRQQLYDELVLLLLRKASAFANYPHQVAVIIQNLAQVMMRMGNQQQAELLLQRQQQRLGRQQDDLRIALAVVRAQQACDTGALETAAQILQDAIWDQRLEAFKALTLLPAYLEVTSKAGTAPDAVQFLERFARATKRRMQQSPTTYSLLLQYLVTAYRNAGANAKADALIETGNF